MSIDLNVVNATVSIASTMTAAISVASGFILYKNNRLDDKYKSIRESMIAAKSLAHELDSMISFELFAEFAETLISTKRMAYFNEYIYSEWFQNKSASNKAGLVNYLDKEMVIIPGSFDNSPISSLARECLSKIELHNSKVEYDFPGIARSIFAAEEILKISINRLKKFYISDDTWKSAIIQIFESDTTIRSAQHLQIEIVDLLIGSSQKITSGNFQSNINDCLSHMDLAISKYLEKGRNELSHASSSEKAVSIRSKTETVSIDEDMSEAEKCFKHTLSTEVLLELKGYSSRIAGRKKPATNDQTE